MLRIVHRVITRFLLKQAAVKRCAADTGAVTLIQRFGSAANLNIHLHCLVLDGVYRRTEAEPEFQEARAPTRAELEGLLDKIISRLMRRPHDTHAANRAHELWGLCPHPRPLSRRARGGICSPPEQGGSWVG